MSEPLILTFDIGTQSLRALLCRPDGSFVDKEKLTYETPYLSPEPGWAEQKPDFYWNGMVQACRSLLGRNPEAVADIAAVTVTTIRDTVLCLDKDNQPLGNIIVWLDQREAKYDPKVLGLRRPVFKLVGMEDTVEAQIKGSVCNWIMQNDPERWEKTAHFVLLSAYLTYRLVGKLVDSVGSTIAHLPFDYRKRRWIGAHGLTRCMADIPADKLIELREPGEELGRITEETSRETLIPAGLPLIATGSDKGCETLGLSVRRPGSAAVSFGTSSTIQDSLPRYVEPQPFLPAYPAAFPGGFNQEIQIYRGYWMVTWFVNEFCSEELEDARRAGINPEALLDARMEAIEPGSEGLFISPYWTPGVVQPNARGSMIGFTDRHTKYHIYRAIIEGINFELMKGRKWLEKSSGTRITELFAAGGGARSKAVLQLTADMFGLPVKQIQTHEASSLGSSMVAFVSLGRFRDYDEACEAMCHTTTVYEPDPARHERYEELFGIYEGLYRQMTPICKKIKKVL